VQILATGRPELRDDLAEYKKQLREKAEAMDERVSGQQAAGG
jgi:phosphoribosylcarboxyaminoimidazole (NCAIR) mutase